MTKTLILYDLNNKTPTQKTNIIRQLFGYKDKSYHGKYEYTRPGTLSKIKHKRQTKTALIIQRKDQKKVIKTLKQAGITSITIA